MDPLSGVIVALFIIQMGWKILKPTFDELVDTTPNLELQNKIKKITEKTPGVLGSYRLRSRSIGNELLVDLEIRVNPALSLYQAHDISEEVKEKIFKTFDSVREVLVHIEPTENITDIVSHEESLLKQVRKAITLIPEVEDVNRVRFHYIPGGIEINIDVVVDAKLSVEQGHDIADEIEKKLIHIKKIVLIHVHVETENKFKRS